MNWFRELMKRAEVIQPEPTAEHPDPLPRPDPLDMIDTSKKKKQTIGDRLDQFASVRPYAAGVAMDDCDGGNDPYMKEAYRRGQPNVSDELAAWYSSASFIGHQLCGLMAQHWLIYKACAQPARDAIRNGFDMTTATGDSIDVKDRYRLERINKRFGLRRNMLEFLTFGRVFGVRVAIFDVDYEDPDVAYAAPFNLDGVRPKSYRGIIQVDPYWCSPELDANAAANPSSMHFYEPTWWQINGRRYHRTHLVVYRHGSLSDILKPAYLYGGIPVPQLIMERVYASERVANEAPLLALTKRTMVYGTDLAKAMMDPDKMFSKLREITRNWTNSGIRVIDKEEDKHEQFDTSLADLDAVIMSQYQLVAAAAEVPATRLLGTQPKGFNATGEFDEASYHETLSSVQEHDLTPFVERHLMIAAKSLEIQLKPMVTWKPLDEPTEQEQAQSNLTKAQTAGQLILNGTIDGTEDRKRLMQDKSSNYAGILKDELGDDSF